MVDVIIKLSSNERVTRTAHWAMFGIGALSLAFAVVATAAQVL